MELAQSEPFCRLLAHMTGLDLAHNIIRPNLSTENSNSESDTPRDLNEDNSTRVIREKQESEPSPHGSRENGENIPGLVGSTDSNGPVAVCRCDLYSWHPGDYTLAGDESDPGYGVFCLDSVLSLNCEGMYAVKTIIVTECHNIIVLPSPCICLHMCRLEC